MEIDLAQVLINSIANGSVYALVAIGLTMVYGILKFANFAHAEAITFGAYMAYIVNVLLGGNLLFGVIIAFLLTGLLGVVSDILVFRRLREKGATRISLMIASIGLGLVVRHLIQGIWGPWVRWYSYAEIRSYEILGGRITLIESWTIITALSLMLSLHLLLT
ncbi:MAG: branched-chain amino acid ABC transporter permease, partial [Candidatus Bathyarchaeota archaeon]